MSEGYRRREWRKAFEDREAAGLSCVDLALDLAEMAWEESRTSDNHPGSTNPYAKQAD